jgi:hypothetical protein
MMAKPLADQIMRKIKQAAELYHRLMLVVTPAAQIKRLRFRVYGIAPVRPW